MCVLSIKLPIRKKSGNLFNDPRARVCVYIYVCVCVRVDRSICSIYEDVRTASSLSFNH